MGENSNISWTDNTFNPWMGCTKVSAGCTNCYAETLVTGRMGHDVWGPGKPRMRTSVANWRKPIQWNKQAEKEGRRIKVFCASLADVFDAEAPAGALHDLWQLIKITPYLDWLLLTKRPERILESLPKDWGTGYPNVWLGTSVEDQRTADVRLPILRSIPARVRFLSMEPLLAWTDIYSASTIGPLGKVLIHPRDLGRDIHWIIVGGESGPGHRRFDPQWAKDIRNQCREAGIAFFYKQEGGAKPGGEALLDGRLHHDFPHPR